MTYLWPALTHVNERLAKTAADTFSVHSCSFVTASYLTNWELTVLTCRPQTFNTPLKKQSSGRKQTKKSVRLFAARLLLGDDTQIGAGYFCM